VPSAGSWMHRPEKRVTEMMGPEDVAMKDHTPDRIEVLIIDDDVQVCRFLSRIFTGVGYSVAHELTLTRGMSQIFSGQVDILFLDVNLPDGNGLEAIPTIRHHPTPPEIIIITADDNVDGAEIAMKSRAWDYISKAGSSKNFRFALERAVEYRRQKKARQSGYPIRREGIVGESPLMQKCLEKVAVAAHSDIPVLVTGETGTGKELVSKAIHANSVRCSEPFVVVDCASLPEHLVESTIFGHTRGAFTGADRDKTGLMKTAGPGTLFLDEVGEMPFEIQKKFLRALQEKKFRPLGSKTEIHSNFRLICATHRNLEEMVKQGKFREDLFFRIVSLSIHLPPLKDRADDVIVLAKNHMQGRAGQDLKNACVMSRPFLAELQIYDWPGNVRELFNTLDRVCAEAGGGATLFPHHLPEHIRAFNIRHRFTDRTRAAAREGENASVPGPESFPGPPSVPGPASRDDLPAFKDHIENTKSTYVRQLISMTRGNIKECCRISGLSRGHLYRLMQQHDIKPHADS
jgi:two-component system, NtrC family, response regulator